jgi:hypothetical protein
MLIDGSGSVFSVHHANACRFAIALADVKERNAVYQTEHIPMNLLYRLEISCKERSLHFTVLCRS